jgi:hypothetical protein
VNTALQESKDIQLSLQRLEQQMLMMKAEYDVSVKELRAENELLKETLRTLQNDVAEKRGERRFAIEIEDVCHDRCR